MKRRNFLETVVGSAALATGIKGGAASGTEMKSVKARIGDHSLESLLYQYRSDLFDDFLPFMEKYVIDHEFGGFMCTTDRDGTNINTHKRTW